MLVLSRRAREALIIDLADQSMSERTLGELFADGPIVIAILSWGDSFVRIGIDAPEGLRILRQELYQESDHP